MLLLIDCEMKYKIIYIAAATAAMTVSCGKQDVFIPKDSDQPAGTVRTERIGLVLADNPGTKVNVDGTTGEITWIPDTDEIAVCIRTGTNSYAYRTCPVNGDSSIEVDLANNQTREYYAIYPASSAISGTYGQNNSSSRIIVNYPNTYDLSGLSTLEAVSKYCPAPMVAINDGSEVLNFYHLGSVMRLNIKNVPQGTSVVKVVMDGITRIDGRYYVSLGGTPNSTLEAINTSGTGNTWTFTLNSSLFESSPDDLILNIPIPTISLSSLSQISAYFKNSGNTTIGGLQHPIASIWASSERGTGRKVLSDYQAEKILGFFGGYQIPRGFFRGGSFTDPFVAMAAYGSSQPNIVVGPGTQSSGKYEIMSTTSLAAIFNSSRLGATVNGETGKRWSNVQVDLTGTAYAGRGIGTTLVTQSNHWQSYDRGNISYGRIIYPDGVAITNTNLTQFQSAARCSLTYDEVLDLMNNYGCDYWPAIGYYWYAGNAAGSGYGDGKTLYTWITGTGNGTRASLSTDSATAYNSSANSGSYANQYKYPVRMVYKP